MKINIVIVSILIGMNCSAGAQWFRHRTTPDNITLNYTLVASHLTESRGDRFFIMPLQRGFGARHVNRSIGLWYPAAERQWSIFNQQNTVPMERELEFSVYRATDEDTVFIHRHVSADQPFGRSVIDHPSLNNRPGAFPFVTSNWDASGVYNISVFDALAYDTTLKKWAIYAAPYDLRNEFPETVDGVTWNVMVRSEGANTFRVQADVNTNFKILDHPLLNENPHALFLVTHESSLASGFSGLRHTANQVQARYDADQARWLLETMSGLDFSSGVRFLVTLVEQSDVPVPELEIKSSPPRNLITIPTEFGFRYQIEASLDLKIWLPEGLPFSGNGETRVYPTTVVLPAANYRISRESE